MAMVQKLIAAGVSPQELTSMFFVSSDMLSGDPNKGKPEISNA
jgi:hypothetical protein